MLLPLPFPDNPGALDWDAVTSVPAPFLLQVNLPWESLLIKQGTWIGGTALSCQDSRGYACEVDQLQKLVV